MNTSWTLQRAIQGIASITVSEAFLEHGGCATSQVYEDGVEVGGGGAGQRQIKSLVLTSHTGTNEAVTQRTSDEASGG